MKNILIIDDEKEICRSLKGILSDEGYQVRAAHTPEAAFVQLQDDHPHLILLDVWFGKGSWDGVHLLDRLTQNYPFIPVIMISGHATLNLAVRAIRKGAVDFLEKPIDVERLLIAVKKALELSEFRLHHSHPNSLSHRLHKQWPFELDAKLKKLVTSDMRALIVGENGMRKERLIHKIHSLSMRKHGPFLTVSGQELNRLHETSFWGKESAGRVENLGFFEYAQGGTLLITNAHHISYETQRRLAKIFEGSSLTRMGGTRLVQLNVRCLLTAPPSFLENGHGEDGRDKEFFDRITLCVCALKPLRDDRRALNAWIDYVLAELSQDLGYHGIQISQEVRYFFQTQEWLGNVRQLYNVLESAVLHANKGTLGLGDVMAFFPQSSCDTHNLTFSNAVYSMPLKTARAVFEFNYVRAQLAAADGNFTKAAEVVGMERSALHRKLKSLENIARLAETQENLA